MRVSRYQIAFVCIAMAAFVSLLWLGRGLTFFSDEWAFIEDRSLGDFSSWLRPHNEHWVTIPVIVYRALVETVGLSTYVPYLAVVALLHVLVAQFVFWLVERQANGLIALGTATVVLLFGSGFENLYWGFQVGFVGATAAGLAAINLLDGPADRRRMIVITALLTVAIASAGVGLFFVGIVAVELVLRPERRRGLVLLSVPIAAYAVWFLSYGRTSIVTHRDPFSLQSLLGVPEFVVRGFGNAFGAVLGVGSMLGLLVALAVAAWIVLARVTTGRSIPPRTAAVAAGIAVQYGLIAVTRAGVTVGQVDYTRYTYVGGILLIAGLAPLVGPWLRNRVTHRKGRLQLAALGLVLFELAVIWNVRLLDEGRRLFVERTAMTRALIAVATAPDRPPDVDVERSLVLVPSPAKLERIVAMWGSPLSDRLVPWAVGPIPPEVMAEAQRRLIHGAPIPRDEN